MCAGRAPACRPKRARQHGRRRSFAAAQPILFDVRPAAVAARRPVYPADVAAWRWFVDPNPTLHLRAGLRSCQQLAMVAAAGRHAADSAAAAVAAPRGAKTLRPDRAAGRPADRPGRPAPGPALPLVDVEAAAAEPSAPVVAVPAGAESASS